MSRLIGLFVLVASLLGGWFWMDYRDTVDAPLGHGATVCFEIGKGQSLAQVATALRERGVFGKPYWFRLLAWRENAAARLKYGEYEIPPSTTPRQLLHLFVAGKVRQYGMAFIEGWRFQDMLEAMSHQPALARELAGKKPTEIMGALAAPNEHPEGRFFPDTYFYAKGVTDRELLLRAYRKMQIVLAEEWAERARDLPLKSPYEALVLASIVEKETALASERAQIAGVFLRRLAKGMPLQTDPTVIYGMGEAFQGNIRKEDLERDTPYNTYKRPGLPPTPIAMPGAASLRAVMRPAAGDSLYFVAKGDGSHAFSRDLAEHNKAVAQYQLKRHRD
jgi:UPF0755 protein